MNIQDKKFILADVDETICQSCQQISPEMAEKIDSLIQKGIQFAFISGTNTEFLLKMISSRLKEKHYILATTGTKCVEVNPGLEPNLIYKHSLNSEEVFELMTAFEKLVTKFEIHSLTTKEDQIQNRETQITLSAIGRHAPSNLKADYDPDGNKRKIWIEYLKTIIDPEKYEITIGGTTSVDITQKGLDKAWGIKKFAQQYNIPLTSILFFGDKTYPGGNDYPATTIVDYIAVKSPADTLQKFKELF